MESVAVMSGALPVSLIEHGIMVTVARIQGRDKVKAFLADLGFVEGAKVMVISEVSGNIIFRVKEARIALGKEMASRIMVH